jgi:hypothetical protein
MAKAFPFRDGECARRTFEAVVDINRPLTDEELYLIDDRGELSG